MSSLRDALIQALKRKQSNESRADAILALLGLEHDDVIVNRNDLFEVLNYAADAENYLLEEYGEDRLPSWEDDQIDRTDDAWFRISDIAGIDWEEVP